MKIIIPLSTILLLIVVVSVFLLCTREVRGALYINQGGINMYICNGVLKTYGEKTMYFSFYCDNGTTIENLVNFTIKEN